MDSVYIDSTLRQQSADRGHGFVPFLRYQLHDPCLGLALTLFLEPVLIPLVDPLLVVPTGDGAAATPEFEVLTEIVGVDAFADQLGVSNQLVEPQELRCGLSSVTTERTTFFRCESSFERAVRNAVRNLIAFSDSPYFVHSLDSNRERIVLSIHAEDDF